MKMKVCYLRKETHWHLVVSCLKGRGESLGSKHGKEMVLKLPYITGHWAVTFHQVLYMISFLSCFFDPFSGWVMGFNDSLLIMLVVSRWHAVMYMIVCLIWLGQKNER